MTHSLQKFFLTGFIILTLFIIIFFTPFIENTNNTIEILEFELYDSGFIWPAPGYMKINSYFGKRTAPTKGASTYHKGIDIGAPEGSKLVAIADGIISYTGFLGGGGYTITLTHEDLKITYCHTDPNFFVSVGDTVSQGQVIGLVGPKYITGVKNNQYKDSSGRPTNGATTGPHLHFGVRKNDSYIDPLSLYVKKEESNDSSNNI